MEFAPVGPVDACFVADVRGFVGSRYTDAVSFDRVDPAQGWKCYGLTTVDRPDRTRRLRKELDRLGIPYSLLEAERPADAFGFLNVGTHGCFLSHLECLRRARADGVDVAVLVEDDAVVVRRFRRRLARIIDELATVEWSMCYLGYLATSSPIRRSPVRLVSDHIARADGWEVTGSHFVAVRATALDSIIENFEERLRPGGHRISPDGVLNEWRRDSASPTLICLPNLARQGPSPSGTTTRPGLRSRLLEVDAIRSVAWPVKRLMWDAASSLPPRCCEQLWNRRVRDRRTDEHSVSAGPSPGVTPPS